jgi:hypothetical protein
LYPVAFTLTRRRPAHGCCPTASCGVTLRSLVWKQLRLQSRWAEGYTIAFTGLATCHASFLVRCDAMTHSPERVSTCCRNRFASLDRPTSVYVLSRISEVHRGYYEHVRDPKRKQEFVSKGNRMGSMQTLREGRCTHTRCLQCSWAPYTFDILAAAFHQQIAMSAAIGRLACACPSAPMYAFSVGSSPGHPRPR